MGGLQYNCPAYQNLQEVLDMARKITDDCMACGICMDECPEEAISEGDPIYVIDPEKCTDCGSCQEVCPNDAIIEV
jgi:ferredoxin